MAKEDVINEFTTLKGLGKVKAELLYNHGIDSMDKLKRANFEELIKIKGISEKNANEIINQLGEKTKEKPIKVKEKADTKAHKEEKDKIKEELEVIEETEEEYKVKQKPDLSKEQMEKLVLRKQIKKRTPHFLREEWFRYKRISKNWRKPDGITSKMRKNLKYRPSLVRVGFRGPKEVRGLHPSGFEEVTVFNVLDLETVNPKKQAVRIGGTVGTKKRLDILKKAEELKIRVLNLRV